MCSPVPPSLFLLAGCGLFLPFLVVSKGHLHIRSQHAEFTLPVYSIWLPSADKLLFKFCYLSAQIQTLRRLESLCGRYLCRQIETLTCKGVWKKKKKTKGRQIEN